MSKKNRPKRGAMMPLPTRSDVRIAVLLPYLMLCSACAHGPQKSVVSKPSAATDECVADFLETSQTGQSLVTPECVSRALVDYVFNCST